MHNATYICPWRQILFPVEAGNTSISDKVSDVLWLSRWGLTNIFFRQYEMNPLSWNLHIFFWGGGIKQIFIWGRGMKKNLWGAISFLFFGGGGEKWKSKKFYLLLFHFILFYLRFFSKCGTAQLSHPLSYGCSRSVAFVELIHQNYLLDNVDIWEPISCPVRIFESQMNVQ